LFIPAWMHVWNWIAIVALLMPVWSIAHQAFVLHAWCKNCMVVQLMVILSAIVVMAGDVCSWEAFTVQSLVALPSFYLLAVYLLDMAFEHYKIVQHPPMDGTVLQLMRNPVLREEILRSGKKVDASEVPDVWVMNPKGEEELFLAISLHCVHCKEQFFKLYKAMEKGELKKYCIRIAISPSPQDTKVIEALAAIAIHESTEKSIRMLAEWYETQNRKLFLMSVKKDLPMEGVKEVLDRMNKAVERLDINGLPAMSLGGYEITPTIFWAKVEWDSLS